jgi:hypothetical protein
MKKPPLVVPFVNKGVIPGGVSSIAGNIIVERNDMTGKTKDQFGRNIKSNNIELGDILTFNYIGRDIPDMSEGNTIQTDNKMILNPMVVFAGYDSTNGNIVGVDFRRFRLAKLNIVTEKLIYALKKYYYVSKMVEGKGEVYTRKTNGEIPYASKIAFRYENFGNGLYGSIGPYLQKYYKSYKAKQMRNAVIINIEQADVMASGLVKAVPGILPE